MNVHVDLRAGAGVSTAAQLPGAGNDRRRVGAPLDDSHLRYPKYTVTRLCACWDHLQDAAQCEPIPDEAMNSIVPALDTVQRALLVNECLDEAEVK